MSLSLPTGTPRAFPTELLPRQSVPACVVAQGSSSNGAGLGTSSCWISQGFCRPIPAACLGPSELHPYTPVNQQVPQFVVIYKPDKNACHQHPNPSRWTIHHVACSQHNHKVHLAPVRAFSRLRSCRSGYLLSQSMLPICFWFGCLFCVPSKILFHSGVWLYSHMFLSYLFCPWCVYSNVLTAWYFLPYVMVKRELCFLHAGAGGCQRHTSTACSCSRRSSHTRCVRDSCPQRHRRLHRSILLEAQCKMIPSPGPPSLARLSVAGPCRACVEPVNEVSSVQVVCAATWDLLAIPNRISSSLRFGVVESCQAHTAVTGPSKRTAHRVRFRDRTCFLQLQLYEG